MARAAFRDVSSLLSGSVIAKPFGVASTMLFARILSKDEMAIASAKPTERQGDQVPKGYIILTEGVKDPAGMAEYGKLASKAMAGSTLLSFDSTPEVLQGEWRGTQIAAAAAERLPLSVAGDGPERTTLEAQARAAGGACRFEGFASRERLATLYPAAGVVVLASRRGEGLPNVLLEAMAFARPVVATACAGTRDIVVDGDNGLIVPPDDLGERARASVERYRWEAVRDRLEAVLAGWSAT